MNALENFTFWLPGELKYAALKGGDKAGYSKRIDRARRRDGDLSMYTFLGTEWKHAQDLLAMGKHHSEDHEKTAQLQYAKFAVGLFDKYATAMWYRAKLPPNVSSYENVAANVAVLINRITPWQDKISGFNPHEDLIKPFDKSVFGAEILDLQIEFVEAVEFDGDITQKTEKFDKMSSRALRLGGMATQCYLAYADEYLNPDQLTLAPSVL